MLGLPVLGLVIFSAISGLKKNEALVSYSGEHLPEFLALADSPMAPSGTRPSGKLFIVDVSLPLFQDKDIEAEWEKGQMEPVGLPKIFLHGNFTGHRAKKPAQIGTVALLKWRGELAFRYSGGTPAYQMECEVTVADSVRGLLLGRKTFRAERPRDRVTVSRYGVSAVFSCPTEQIKNYINDVLHMRVQ